MSHRKKDSQKIVLEALSQERVNDYVVWFNDERVFKYLSKTLPSSKKCIRKWIESTTQDTNSLYFSIVAIKRKSKSYLGHIGIKNYKAKTKSAETGIVIGEPSMWGCGVGYYSHALLIKQLGTSKLRIKKLIAKIRPDNARSIKMFNKLGYIWTKKQILSLNRTQTYCLNLIGKRCSKQQYTDNLTCK